MQTQIETIIGQEPAKRAMEIAIAGLHPLLITGPSGSGKTALARALGSIMPTPSPAVLDDIAAMWATSPIGAEHGFHVHERPFVSTRISRGELPLRSMRGPSYIDLARDGVLAIEHGSTDVGADLGAFQSDLAHWLDNGRTDDRAPLVVVTMETPVMSKVEEAQAFFAPFAALFDRFPISTSTELLPDARLPYLVRTGNEEIAATIRWRVEVARARQAARLGAGRTNEMMTPGEIAEHVRLTDGAQRLLNLASVRLGLSTRGTVHAMKVARTIADLPYFTNESDPIIDVLEERHVGEAIAYRAPL